MAVPTHAIWLEKCGCHLVSPCDALDPDHTGNSQPRRNGKLYYQCLKLFEQEVSDRVRSWCPIKSSTDNNLPTRVARGEHSKFTIFKRQIAGIVVGVLWAVTDLIQSRTAISDESRFVDAINTNNKELGLISHAMYNMEKTLNATVQLQQYEAKAIELLAQHVAENSRNIQLLEEITPQQAWTITFVHSKITQAGTRLEKVMQSWKRGKVSHELVELFNLSSIIDYDEEATTARGCSVLETGIVNIRFDILTRYPTTIIVQADPFVIWANVTGTPCLEKYGGSPYMVYNATSDCRAEMQVVPFEHYVSYQCAEEHYQANENVPPKIQYKITSQKIFIYCYDTNITIKEARGSFRCPPHVFSLPPNLSWRADNVGFEDQIGTYQQN